MKAEPIYIEGPKALANFEQFATAILRSPKPKIKAKKQQARAATTRKSKNADKD